MNGRGFGTVGVVIAAEIAALIIALCVPAFQNSALHRHARQVVKEIKLVRDAATAVHARSGTWPEDGSPGRVPSSMQPLLPKNFDFDRDDHTLEWNFWTLGGSGGPAPARDAFLGVSVTARDPRLLHCIEEVLGNEQMHVTVGDRLTVVTQDSGGVSGAR